MIICHCKAVSERTVREAVREGARSCRQVTRSCEAGRICGGCRPLIREIIEAESPPSPIFSAFEELATT